MVLSVYILTGFAGWLVAQLLKVIIAAIKQGKANPREIYLSGGMPSSHSSTVVSMLVIVGAIDGVDSAIFGVTVMLAAIVMYDAVMVRRSSGEQGEALTALIKEQKSNVRLPRVAKGHTPIEVAVGGLVGLVVGLLALVIYYNVGS